MGLMSRLAHAWNVFRDADENYQSMATSATEFGGSYTWRPDRPRYFFKNEKTIISAIYTRLAIDIAAIPIKHVRLDENDQYLETMDSGLNGCLKIEANIDQGATHFRQDIAQQLFDNGVVAILPVETSLNPKITGGYDINSLRAGQVLEWYPKHVKVRAYNENRGRQEDVIVPKSMVAIVENPLYSVMNEPSSTLQRLLRKLSLLDAVDEQSASGKLDILIQLPYVIKTEARRKEAEKRTKEIEFQLKGSQHGIAYVDGTEKIIQLNRPVENNLMGQIEFLTKLLYSQLGITEEVMNGTANEETMINYHSRSIKPILTAICEAMQRTFLTKTARSQGQAIKYFRNPFELIPVTVLAEVVDKFTRNEVASGNEMRGVIGWAPSKDPQADVLRNKNIPQPVEPAALPAGKQNVPAEIPVNGSQATQSDAAAIVNTSLDDVDKALDDAFDSLGISG